MARSNYLPLFTLNKVVGAALSVPISVALAQPAPATSQQLEPVTVTGRSTPSLNVGGWGDLPLNKTPVQASIVSAEQIKDSGAQRLSDLIGFDPAISDAYNAEGYYDFLSVRGFVIDNRFNYRRDGLPINAETAIPLDNKSRVEILKGTSGMQAGTSAPGGLVNFVVKRPTDAPLRSAGLEWRQAGSVTGAVDLSQRFGVGQAFGVRLNAAAAHFDPQTHSAEGNRHLFALAADWRISADSLLEAEVETSHRSQPSVPGFSLLGNNVPSPSDPRINLNNQPWSLPVVFDANTASLRWQQRLGADWRFTAHLATQQLRTDDRVAFPFGCSAENDYTRFCKDGSFDLYDFRSDGEHRNSKALDLYVAGRTSLAGMAHRFNAGVLSTRFNSSFGRQAYNYVGSGTVDGLARVPADPSLTGENTNRDERSTELHLQDVVAIAEKTSLWIGLRNSRLQRDSVRTNGSRATAYSQSFTTPWLALSQTLGVGSTVYASWGQGIESEVAPNRTRYTNAGQALPALKSRQLEAGYKQSGRTLDWRVAGFDIERPEWRDVGACDVTASCVKRADGTSRHTGVEAEAEWRSGAMSLRGSAMLLRARRDGSTDASLNGKRPTNVPAASLKLQAAYNVAAVPGLALLGFITHEGERMVLPDNSVATPGWTRIDLGARYAQRLGAGNTAVWRVGIDNIANQRAWKEAPYQYGHAYLYPLAPRALHASVAVNF